MYDVLRRTLAHVRYRFPSVPLLNLQVLDSDTWTDDEITRAVESTSYLGGSDVRLVQMSEDAVVKNCRLWDYANPGSLVVELVRTRTRIDILRMRRVIRYLKCQRRSPDLSWIWCSTAHSFGLPGHHCLSGGNSKRF